MHDGNYSYGHGGAVKYLASSVYSSESVHQGAMNSLATAVVHFWYNSILVSACHATLLVRAVK